MLYDQLVEGSGEQLGMYITPVRSGRISRWRYFWLRRALRAPFPIVESVSMSQHHRFEGTVVIDLELRIPPHRYLALRQCLLGCWVEVSISAAGVEVQGCMDSIDLTDTGMPFASVRIAISSWDADVRSRPTP